MNSKKIIFVGGLHRSGTSLLHQILRSHPDVSGFHNTGVPEDEGQHLQSVYLPAAAFGGPGRFGFRKDALMDENHPLATTKNADKLWQEWSQYWNLDKPFLVEKSPPNLLRTRFLNQLFPECKIVIVLRHPIAVAYATKKWCKSPIPLLIEHNLRCYEQFFTDSHSLSNIYLLRYEEFVAEPKKHVSALLEWIGLQSFQNSVRVNSNVNRKYFQEWQNVAKTPIKKSLFDAFSNYRKFDKRASRFGYSFSTPEALAVLKR
ncbi:MAG: Sulfotransferase family [Phormidesmis priestleyi Ana]|uniref:Sulfotransferase family n=1 Tax=Phormidesmis priestleyi Ana TaxID=1666911 RepID=A0A0P7ZF24_9CYAN|nr:MAG: Sulfotransferase family [Phormidesmis priestleyi Ana]